MLIPWHYRFWWSCRGFCDFQNWQFVYNYKAAELEGFEKCHHYPDYVKWPCAITVHITLLQDKGFASTKFNDWIFCVSVHAVCTHNNFVWTCSARWRNLNWWNFLANACYYWIWEDIQNLTIFDAKNRTLLFQIIKIVLLYPVEINHVCMSMMFRGIQSCDKTISNDDYLCCLLTNHFFLWCEVTIYTSSTLRVTPKEHRSIPFPFSIKIKPISRINGYRCNSCVFSILRLTINWNCDNYFIIYKH